MSKAFSVQFIVCAVEREVNYFTACANIFVLLWLGFLNHLVTESQEKPEYLNTCKPETRIVYLYSSETGMEAALQRRSFVGHGVRSWLMGRKFAV